MQNRLKHWARPGIAASAALVLGIALTGLAVLWQTKNNAAVAADRFEALCTEVVDRVIARLRTYEYGLRGARGAILMVGVEHPDRQRFFAYSQSRDIRQEFPGARGFGLIRRVAPDRMADFVAEARLDGAPDFEIRQFQPHTGERFVIQYIEPIEANREAVGFDVASEPRRRQAAEEAMRTGTATLTAPVTLVQASAESERAICCFCRSIDKA